MHQPGTRDEERRFAARLESFSDLVFGFSLSLLALRLDIPSRVEDIFEPTRWLAVILTFFLICRFWLEHHRIFRHHFAVKTFDMMVIFAFLFAIAILPYAVQVFIRFNVHIVPLSLYLGDVILVFITLSILRVRGLRQRRLDPDVAVRLDEWRRSVALMTVAILAACLLAVLKFWGSDFQSKGRNIMLYAVPIIIIAVRLVRKSVRQLPAFLRQEG